MQRITVLQPVRSTAPSANYPDGSSQNESVPGANDGTPWELARSNDIFGLQQALLHQLGIVPSGLAETALVSQFLEGVARLASVAQVFVDSGAADAYVATQIGLVQAQSAYFDGMEVVFKPTNTNTGASTINVSALGVKSVTLQDGSALTAGLLLTGVYATLRYNLASSRFELVTPFDTRGVNKAWVKFNGTGAVSIFNSFNVSSITDNGVGDYTLNFTNLMADADYALAGSVRRVGFSQAGIVGPTDAGIYTNAAVQVLTTDDGGVAIDPSIANVIIAGD